MGLPPKVFISYSHDSLEHEDRVLDLANRLREGGIDAEVDQYEDAPPEGWPTWCERQIKSAGFVLLVCTETYMRRVDGEAAPGIGHGVLWEARIIRQLLYDAGSVSAKFVPVLFSDGSPDHIPMPVKGAACFVVDDEKEYERLYRLLTAQPRVLKPVLGRIEMLPPKQRKSSGTIVADASAPSQPWPTPHPPADAGSSLFHRERGGAKALADFAVFRDGEAPWYPEMVVIPAGQFLMGSPDGDRDAYDDERPRHQVRIGSRFAIGRYPVTVSEYRRFVDVTGYTHAGGIFVPSVPDWKEDAEKSWQEPGFSQIDCHPVVGIAWKDAKAYAEWLSKKTGNPYRLPTEAEWEYACRAGTTTRYASGDEITPQDANFGGTQHTTAVGSYPPNRWSLYDVHGNVLEWVEDVWHARYAEAPQNGSAWLVAGDESMRVVRGGSWMSLPRDVRSAVRSPNRIGIRSSINGFRLARGL